MKKIMVATFLFFLVFASPLLAETWSKNLDLSITSDKDEYKLGTQAVFDILISRANRSAQIFPHQIVAYFPGENNQIALFQESKGHYRYTSFLLDSPGEASLTVKIYKPMTFEAIGRLEAIKEKFHRRIYILEDIKRNTARDGIITWVNRLTAKYEFVISRIDLAIAKKLTEQILIQGRKTVSVILSSPDNPEGVLSILKENNRKLFDMRADMTVKAFLNGESFGETDYSRYYFKQPDREKIVSFYDEERNNQGITYVICGPQLHIVYPEKEEFQTTHVSEQAGISFSQFNQMNLFFDPVLFSNSHYLAVKETNPVNSVVTLEAIPKEPNHLYSKLELHIDYYRGMLKKWLLFNSGSSNEEQLLQTLEVLKHENIGGVWIPTKIVKIPQLTPGKEFKAVMEYSRIKVNSGLTENEFNPEFVR